MLFLPKNIPRSFKERRTNWLKEGAIVHLYSVFHNFLKNHEYLNKIYRSSIFSIFLKNFGVLGDGGDAVSDPRLSVGIGSRE
jgi:hypothetical protein